MEPTATLSILRTEDKYLFHLELPTDPLTLAGQDIHAPSGVTGQAEP